MATLSVFIPYGFLLPILILTILVFLIIPLKKLLFYIWIGIFISSFFGAYLGIPGSESIFLFRILLLLHFLFFLFLPEKKLSDMKSVKWLFFILIAWFVGFSITLFWSDSLNASVRYIYYMFELIYLIFLVTYYLSSKKMFFLFSKIITVVYLLEMFIGFLEVITGFHLPQSGAFVYDTATSAYQPTGLLFNTNDYAFLLVIFFPIVFWRLTYLRKLYCFISLSVISVGSVYLVITTYSRLGLLIFGMMILAILVTYFSKWSIFIGAWSCLIISSILLFSPSTLSKIQGIIMASFTEKGASTSDRVERYNTLWQIIKDTNLLGVGAGNAPIKLQQYRIGYAQIQETILAPHNFWLEVIADGGFLGIFPVLFFLALLLMSMYYGWIMRKQNSTLFVILPVLLTLTFLVSAVALSTVIDKRYLWIAIGMAVAVVNIIINQKKELSK
ncbi:O-antigen ligase domain-containing protein [Listeria monocytogenes]|nr:O-antigen ligase domain-containing protein [Listeria monocytogenes]EAD4839046.1 O-antigen ligase domain-containing protein [Listeria monocytogenes]EAD4869063.1 O-antigen ligase domain-containing protein [Listeria monocytogenes]EAH0457905.1 O-antigen ligase domain-containing protein [Listeria monocytogenes]MCV12398.1 O-antigen ligase domain-containing protein [Listeria monocytogenes]